MTFSFLQFLKQFYSPMLPEYTHKRIKNARWNGNKCRMNERRTSYWLNNFSGGPFYKYWQMFIRFMWAFEVLNVIGSGKRHSFVEDYCSIYHNHSSGHICAKIHVVYNFRNGEMGFLWSSITRIYKRQ